jgi:hypothetical protein
MTAVSLAAVTLDIQEMVLLALILMSALQILVRTATV